ncbi:hypothetical protein KR222_005284, partial [Zaprionus bogoriensis]
SYSDSQEQKQQTPPATTQNPNKRKRKRRKQQKRRPVYDSLDQDDATYDYYASALRLSMAQQQPMFYYGPDIGSYYDSQRLQAFNDYASSQPSYYNPLFADSAPVEEHEEELQFNSDENLGKLNTKKVTVLRPLGLTIKLPANDQPSALINSDTEEILANEEPDNEEVNASLSNPNADSDSASVDDDDGSAALSASMRNEIGTYMRDDLENRERQRQSEKQVEPATSAVEKPRQHQHFLFAARLFK